MKIIIYTDGSCKAGNPGRGGYAAIIQAKVDNEIRKELFVAGRKPNATNNQMEMMAVITAITTITKSNTSMTIVSDSKYVINGITKWVKSWKAKGWKREEGEIKNLDLWKQLDRLNSNHNITWRWVKGHANNELNNMVDRLAQACADEVGSDTTFICPKCLETHTSKTAQMFGWKCQEDEHPLIQI